MNKRMQIETENLSFNTGEPEHFVLDRSIRIQRIRDYNEYD